MVAERGTRRQQHDASESLLKSALGIDLPTAPSRGNRRTLEAMWLERLEASGIRASDLEVPETTPGPLVSAVQQFNEGRYWDCHETLEDLWRETPYPLRFAYHALIKAAVGFHHLSRRNRNGARLKLSDAVRLLSLFQPEILGIRTDMLRNVVSKRLSLLEEDQPTDWPRLEALRQPVIQTTWGNEEAGPKSPLLYVGEG